MDLRMIRLVAASIVPQAIVLAAVASWSHPGDGWGVTGSLIVLLAGLASLVGIVWLQQWPIAPGDGVRYGRTVLMKLAVVETTVLVGFVMTITVGPWWLSILAAPAALLGLWISWPTEADRERHELLYLV